MSTLYIYISTTWKVDGATPIRLGLSECQSPLLSLATELGSGDHNHLLSLRCKTMHNFSQATVDGSEIPNNHLGCIKTRHKWDKRPTNLVSRISAMFCKKVGKQAPFPNKLLCVVWKPQMEEPAPEEEHFEF